MEDEQLLFRPEEAALLERLPAALCTFRIRAGRPELLTLSDGLCRLLEGTRTELLRQYARGPEGWLYPDDLAGARDALAAACRQPEGAFRAVLRLRTAADGFVACDCAGAMTAQPDGDGLLCVSCALAESGGRNHPEIVRPVLGRPETENSGPVLAEGQCSLTENRVLAYARASGAFPDAAAGTDYGALVGALAETPAEAAEREKLAALFGREALLEAFRSGRTHTELPFGCERMGVLPVWVVLEADTYAEADGGVGCALHVRDITDKTLERQIFSRLSLLGFDMLGMLYVKTGACRYFRILRRYATSIYEHLEDYNASIREDVEKIIVPEEKNLVLESLRIEAVVARLEEAEIFPFAYSMIGRDGVFRRKLLQFSYLDKRKDTIFFCKSDITQQYASEHRQIEELKAAKLEADRANEAKSMFLSSVSHDLRTPLSGVLGFTDIALRERDPEKIRDYLLKIRTSGSLLLDLVNDTLELSRIESGKVTLETEDFDNRELGCSVVTALRPTAELKGVRLEAEPSDFPAGAVRTDRRKLQKIYLNLLSNAIKYTPEGGTVRVRLERLTPPEDGCGYRLTVEDTGIGISPEFLPHVFEPFSQEHRKESANILGTGLGLAIVKRNVELMGGRIAVSSQPGRGTRFTAELPMETAESAPRETQAQPETERSLNGRRALLCEDNYLNTEIASILLREQGMEVDCAENGREGLEKFRASAPDFYDVVLMDIRMPVMDGYEAAGAIRALDRPDAKRVPILAMTADAFEEDLRRAETAGMNGAVTKPVDPGRLMSTLRRLIG